MSPMKHGRQGRLSAFATDDDPDDQDLTDAERDAWTRVEQGDTGVREFARKTGRSPGTVGNLLARARAKVDGEEAT